MELKQMVCADGTIITYVSIGAWDDASAIRFGDIEVIELRADGIRLDSPPEERQDPSLDGHSFVKSGSPYSFDGNCPECGEKTSFRGFGDTSWEYVYDCRSCSCVTIVAEGDKMGGCFDHYDVFKPNK